MREIKFRVWAAEDNCMYDWEATNSIRLVDAFTDTGWLWMQYTGLKDKNGVEIYEGDLLSDDRLENYEGYILSCRWEEAIAAFMFGDGDFDPQEVNELEVIGNIYENPELLKAS